MNPHPSASRTREATNLDGESGDTDEENEAYNKVEKSELSQNFRDIRTRSPYYATVTRAGGRSTRAVPLHDLTHNYCTLHQVGTLYPRQLIRWLVSLLWLSKNVCGSLVKIHLASICCEDSGEAK